MPSNSHSCQGKFSAISRYAFSAATDHRFIGGGHTLDFTNKALEALDIVGWNDKELVASVLSSLVSGYADAERMEESTHGAIL